MTRRWYRVPRLCDRCGRVRSYAAKGLCQSCYGYVRRPYQPTGKGRGGLGVRRRDEDIKNRLIDYAQLRSWGLTVEEAADRMGISNRTGFRYQARLKTGTYGRTPARTGGGG